MTEVKWKSLEFIGYPLYQVSTEGDVRNVKTGKLIKPLSTRYGYYKVNLYNEENKKAFKVHRLVAMAFIPNPDNLSVINHKDKCRTNNRVDNLEWCDMRYNIEYSNINSPVCKYDSEGNLLSKYWSIREAACCNKISERGLRHYLNGEIVTVVYYGFIYRYEGQSPLEPIRNDKAIEQNRGYYQKNKEKLCEYQRLYSQANKERLKEYRLAHKKEKREYDRNYRLKKKSEQAQEKPTLNN